MAYILFITPSPESEVVSLDFCQKILVFIAVHRKLWITQFRTYESHASISNYETEAIQGEKDQQLVI